MTNEELKRHGFEPSPSGGECHFCREQTPKGELFWQSTSAEYAEGDDYCRACASDTICPPHEWVGGGDYGGSPPTICAKCGVDIEDEAEPSCFICGGDGELPVVDEALTVTHTLPCPNCSAVEVQDAQSVGA